MNEELLQFIWKFGLYQSFSIEGNYEDFQIINPGVQNRNAGPDFSEAQIKYDGINWAGNVEIHLKSSDWYRHNHHLDKAYNNVILQVVIENDKKINTENGREVPVLKLTVDKAIEQKFHEFKNNETWIPCEPDIRKVDEFKIKMWLGNVLVERLNEKSEYIGKMLEMNKNSWEETFYQLLARNFGFRINADPFEWLAKSIPLKYLAKHQNSLLQIEALLFGQAGFLSSCSSNDEYYLLLKKEYEFLKAKFSLTPIEKHLWKFMRLRPPNFPTIRISQFAALVNKSKSLFSKIMDAQKVDEIKQFFKVEATEYWDNHYMFEKVSEKKKKVFGEDSINNILINTVIPLLFQYGKLTSNEEVKEKSLNFLEKLKPEFNQIVKNWNKTGITTHNAFDTQALLQQKKHYCQKTRCLECGIGIEIIKRTNGTN